MSVGSWIKEGTVRFWQPTNLIAPEAGRLSALKHDLLNLIQAHLIVCAVVQLWFFWGTRGLLDRVIIFQEHRDARRTKHMERLVGLLPLAIDGREDLARQKGDIVDIASTECPFAHAGVTS